VGAKPNSLGEAIATEADRRYFDVECAGISGEAIHLDANETKEVALVMGQGWDHVVCTVGINRETDMLQPGWMGSITAQTRANFYGPMVLLGQWVNWWMRKPNLSRGNTDPRHFVAISSNSAQVARSTGMGYCASKAALSMALRCAGRDLATRGLPFSVYGYEPGWLAGTPMSDEVRQRLDGAPPHRIPAGDPIDTKGLAAQIVNGLEHSRYNLNGTVLRVDGGEQ
jgi:NAD(P)-dependent dehydrogenase (short-subunit alcohol dehydrogenase family)